MRPVVRLRARVLQVRNVAGGRDRRLQRHLAAPRAGAASPPPAIGYADGWLRSLSEPRRGGL